MLDLAGAPVNVPSTPAQQSQVVLNDVQVLALARWCATIESHYSRPMDIEWALNGETGEMSIVQARPETVRSQETAGSSMTTFALDGSGTLLTTGVAVGQRIASGRVFVLESMAEAARFEDGGVLVARITDPDWVPLMKRASAIVTNAGGRTSHAAIVSRELGFAAIAGCGTATTALADGATVTVSCAEGPEGRTQIMLNIADPDAAMRWWRLPARGVGFARVEFVIENMVKAHPVALLHPEQVDETSRAQIAVLTAGYPSPAVYFVDRMATGVATIAASQWPHPMIVRSSDFKTNEYAGLLGGAAFEPHEEYPMLGFRGAARYYHEHYREGFGLECRAIRQVREDLGLRNVVVMIPFCRTVEEADRVLEEMARHGLTRGVEELEVYVMAEFPVTSFWHESSALASTGSALAATILRSSRSASIATMRC